MGIWSRVNPMLIRMKVYCKYSLYHIFKMYFMNFGINIWRFEEELLLSV